MYTYSTVARTPPYLSPYHRPVTNSAKFRENINSTEMGKLSSSAQNSAFRGKQWSLTISKQQWIT